MITAALVVAPILVQAGAATKTQEEAVKRLLQNYQKAIETKDLSLFRSVKPSLSGEEERRLRKAFDSTRTHEVSITLEGLECQEGQCLARLTRRDTLDGSIVSSFPQTLRIAPGPEGFVIDEIGR
ncbi:MAG: hypothetical protein ACHQM7_03020 [Vicinamibacterales bacterium]